MRLAIVSDIHGNMAAFEAVLADLDRQDVDEVLLGGDLADCGRQPADVLDAIMSRRWPAVRGNSDRILYEVLDGRGEILHEPAWLAVARWTLTHLKSRHIDYLRSLPAGIRRTLPGGRELLLVHATPWHDRAAIGPAAPPEQTHKVFAEAKADVVAHGHIHTAYWRPIERRLLIGIGAVSWSYDQDPRPAYSILDVDGGVAVEVRRVAYDVDRELAAMDAVDHPLPASHRHRMRHGGPLPVWAAPARLL
jgi:predicted phosphodiesterase